MITKEKLLEDIQEWRKLMVLDDDFILDKIEVLRLALKGLAAEKLERAIEMTQGKHFENDYDKFYRNNGDILDDALAEYREAIKEQA